MLWIVRSVDLICVAYTEEAFATRKEAEEAYRGTTKSETYKDMLIRVRDMDIEDYVDYEFDLQSQDYDIVKSR